MTTDLFPIVLSKKNNEVFGFIKELGLFEKGPDASSVFEKLEQRKAELLCQLKEANLEHLFREAKKEKDSLVSWPWICKTSIIALFIAIPIFTVVQPLGKIFSKVSVLVSELTEIPFTEHLISSSKRLQTMPSQRKEELKEALHSIAIELAPFKSELDFLLNNTHQRGDLSSITLLEHSSEHPIP